MSLGDKEVSGTRGQGAWLLTKYSLQYTLKIIGMTPETRLAIFVTVMLVTNLYYTVTSYLFFTRANRPTIRKRMVPLCALILIGTYITGNVTLSNTGLFNPIIPIPCALRLVIQTMFGPMWLFGNLLRALNLLYMSLVNQLMYDVSQGPAIRPFEKMPHWKRIFLRLFSSRIKSELGGIKSLFTKSGKSFSVRIRQSRLQTLSK